MAWLLCFVNYSYIVYLLTLIFVNYFYAFIMFPNSPQAEQLMKQIGVEGVSLTEYEMNVATHLVDPRIIKVNTNTINGNLASHYISNFEESTWFMYVSGCHFALFIFSIIIQTDLE